MTDQMRVPGGAYTTTEPKETPDLSDLSPDQLLWAFLDACRDKDQEAADAISYELHLKVWCGDPLPRDPRPSREETKRLLAASVALMQCRDVLEKIMDGMRANNQVYEALVAVRKALE